VDYSGCNKHRTKIPLEKWFKKGAVETVQSAPTPAPAQTPTPTQAAPAPTPAPEQKPAEPVNPEVPPTNKTV
jgi:hypothetical protein